MVVFGYFKITIRPTLLKHFRNEVNWMVSHFISFLQLFLKLLVRSLLLFTFVSRTSDNDLVFEHF